MAGTGSAVLSTDGAALATDRHWMQRALELARRAQVAGEVPVGAVLVREGELAGEGWNRNIGLNDPCAHAEVLALRAAGARLGNHRLPGCDLYVTLEPCPMCVGACIHARVRRVVYGAADPKTGALGGCFDLLREADHNHVPQVSGGVLSEESSGLLRAFFQARR